MFALLLTACLHPEPAAAPGCADCHGSGSDPAPPVALGGVTDPAYRGVGAHTAHLEGSGKFRTLRCGECHAVPGSVDAEGHVDTDWPAEVAWTDRIGGAEATFAAYDAAGATCTVYCHGADRPDAAAAPVSWVSGGPLACEDCHGNPPPTDGHDGVTAETPCADCHARTPEQHADGCLQAPGVTCEDETTTPTDTGTPPSGGGCAGGCHGAAGVPQPPDAAHATHLAPPSSRPVDCGDCHPSTSSGVHNNGEADVILGGIAAAGSRVPTWSGATCSDTWCHAQEGGTDRDPAWADAGAGLACTACHAMAPASVPDHAGATQCTGCHPDAGPGPSITDPSRHVDGDVTQ